MPTDKHARQAGGDPETVKVDAESAEMTGEQETELRGEGFVLRDGGEGRARSQASGGLPPVDFSGFVLGLGQTVLIQLGAMPEPGSGRSQVDLAQAAHTIDLLDLLAEKTRGNLSEQEAELLSNLRKELKLKYVQAR